MAEQNHSPMARNQKREREKRRGWSPIIIFEGTYSMT
jgi:hypothetical protein